MPSEAAHVAEGIFNQVGAQRGVWLPHCWFIYRSMSKHICANLEQVDTSHVPAAGQSRWSVPQCAQPGHCTGVSCCADGETASDP